MGPFLYSMLVFLVSVTGLLRRRCIWFSAFTLLLVLFYTCPCLILGGLTCIGWKYFATMLVCVLCCGRLVFLLPTWGLSSASNILLLLHISTPLVVHRIRLHSNLNKGSIAEGFSLSIARIGCFSSQSWMSRVGVCYMVVREH